MNLSKSTWAQTPLVDSSIRNGEPQTVPEMLLGCQRLQGVFSWFFVIRRLFFQIVSISAVSKIAPLHQVRIIVILAITFLISEILQSATTRLFPRAYNLSCTCSHVLKNYPTRSVISEIFLSCIKPWDHI